MKHHLTARPKGYLTSLRAMKDKFGSLIDFTLVFDPKAKVSFKPVSTADAECFTHKCRTPPKRLTWRICCT